MIGEDWCFFTPLNEIDVFEWNNNVSVNVLAVQGEKIHILRKSKFDDQRRIINLPLVAENQKRHYIVIKNLI